MLRSAVLILLRFPLAPVQLRSRRRFRVRYDTADKDGAGGDVLTVRGRYYGAAAAGQLRPGGRAQLHVGGLPERRLLQRGRADAAHGHQGALVHVKEPLGGPAHHRFKELFILVAKCADGKRQDIVQSPSDLPLTIINGRLLNLPLF